MVTGMEKFIAHSVHADVEVRVTREMPPIPPALDAHIEAIWANASARVAAGGCGRLFNGQVFSIDTLRPDRITGHLTEYRRLVAQVEDHALYPELGVRVLAAAGVLRCSGGIVLGCRPGAAIYQPGMWQLCPAGSVDAGALRPNGMMDYRRQLLSELHEELGISPETVSDVTPLCVVEHPGSHVCDFGMSLRTTLNPEAIFESHCLHGNGEYDPLRIVPVAELSGFIIWAGAKLVPPAPVFLARAGLLPPEPL